MKKQSDMEKVRQIQEKAKSEHATISEKRNDLLNLRENIAKESTVVKEMKSKAELQREFASLKKKRDELESNLAYLNSTWDSEFASASQYDTFEICNQLDEKLAGKNDANNSLQEGKFHSCSLHIFKFNSSKTLFCRPNSLQRLIY